MEVGNAELGGKSCLHLRNNFFLVEDHLLCVCSERVSRGSDLKYLFIIHWMSSAIRGERTQFQVANKLADALSWLIILISRTASAGNHVSPGHVAAH
jgi:hypothetical protein